MTFGECWGESEILVLINFEEICYVCPPRCFLVIKMNAVFEEIITDALQQMWQIVHVSVNLFRMKKVRSV